MKSSTRPAPVITEAAPEMPKAQVKKRGNQQSIETIKAMKPNPENRGPISKMLKRVRGDDAKRKAEQEEDAKRPTKAQCERPNATSLRRSKEAGSWEMSSSRPLWACFPLAATPNGDRETANGNP